MFAFITIGTNDLTKSSYFYDEILKPLGILKVLITNRYIGYCKKENLLLVEQGKSELIQFYLMRPYDNKIATYGNGTMIVFDAKTRNKVNQFHKIALDNGGLNEGSPGTRHDEFYYAYIRDLDGNKICAFSSI